MQPGGVLLLVVLTVDKAHSPQGESKDHYPQDHSSWPQSLLKGSWVHTQTKVSFPPGTLAAILLLLPNLSCSQHPSRKIELWPYTKIESAVKYRSLCSVGCRLPSAKHRSSESCGDAINDEERASHPILHRQDHRATARSRVLL